MPDIIFRAESAKLLTRLSSERAGLGEYVVKRDWRRDLDSDCRREGMDYFWPNVLDDFATDPGDQPFPAYEVTLTTLTRSTTTATATVTGGHYFTEGETVLVAGASPAAYNGTFVTFNVTPTTFQYTMASDPGASGSGTILARDAMRPYLVHEARRPNGEHAVIYGTKTKLWRFFGMEDGDYASDDYFLLVPPPDEPYAASNTSEWQLIGWGFSPNGHRWEALNINGYTVLNNGVDLPVTYRLEEAEVVPIYELREQGIAAVGTIGETNGILMCGDISEINDRDKLIEIMSPVGDIDGVDMTATQTTTTVTTPADFFTDGTGGTVDHTGRTFVWDNELHQQSKITVVTDARTVTVDVSQSGFTADRFTLRNKATQTGAEFSGLITGSVPASPSSPVVTASSAFFAAGNVGKTLRFSNGFSAEIDVFTDSTHVTLAENPSESISGLPFWITNDAAFVLVADADAFDANMVGQYIVFDTGEIRQIVEYTNATTVVVDSDSAIVAGDFNFFEIENGDAYAAFTDETYIDRIQYRTIWSMPDEPRRFGALVPAGIEEGSQTVELLFPAQSFEAGQEIILVGAGEDGGNLTANILSVTELGKSFLLSETASTTIDAGDDPDTDDGFIERTDAIGSIVGFEDLQDDSSGILRIQALGENTLIIYKDTCMFTAFYTGDVNQPWDFKRIKLPEALTLHYRWTLCNVGGQFHVFAGANSFFRFDLSTRVPIVIPELDLISDIFFSQASLEDTDEIFAADNAVTNEVFFWFPSASDEKAICFDYKQSSAATSSIEMAAAATVKKPMVGTLAGATTDLFVMANPSGVVLVYGKADADQAAWDDEKEIFYRRSAYPFTATTSGYDSVLQSGWGDFGVPEAVKDLMQYVLYLASQSPDCGLRLTIEGTRNPSEIPVVLMEEFIPSPETENMRPTFFRQNFYRYKILITGKNNPCRITKHAFKVEGVMSENHERRP